MQHNVTAAHHWAQVYDQAVLRTLSQEGARMDAETVWPYYNLTHKTQPVTRTPELREVLREGARSGGDQAVGWYEAGVVPRYVVARQHLKARVAEPLRAVLHWRSIVSAIRWALTATNSNKSWQPWLQR